MSNFFFPTRTIFTQKNIVESKLKQQIIEFYVLMIQLKRRCQIPTKFLLHIIQIKNWKKERKKKLYCIITSYSGLFFPPNMQRVFHFCTRRNTAQDSSSCLFICHLPIIHNFRRRENVQKKLHIFSSISFLRKKTVVCDWRKNWWWLQRNFSSLLHWPHIRRKRTWGISFGGTHNLNKHPKTKVNGKNKCRAKFVHWWKISTRNVFQSNLHIKCWFCAILNKKS